MRGFKAKVLRRIARTLCQGDRSPRYEDKKSTKVFVSPTGHAYLADVYTRTDVSEEKRLYKAMKRDLR
jgi:hypothetical protein